jgi:hypothetical protein
LNGRSAMGADQASDLRLVGITLPSGEHIALR